MDYVLGFCYSKDGNKVVLIKKTKPQWQAGRYNAVGGKIEENEKPTQAMQREFFEEAGLKIDEWERTAILNGFDWRVHVFRTFADLDGIKTKTEEPIEIYNVTELPSNCISNLRWLVPLNLDRKGGLDFPLEINYLK